MTIYRKTLAHTGILGMKWGIRRYQNEDGSLTPAGKERYSKTGKSGYEYKSLLTKHHEKKADKLERKEADLRSRGKINAADRVARKANRSRAKAEYNADIDKRVQEYARTENAGANFAKQFFSGGLVGNKGYATALATLKGDKGSSHEKKSTAAGMNFTGRWIAGPFADLVIRRNGFANQERMQELAGNLDDAASARQTFVKRYGR